MTLRSVGRSVVLRSTRPPMTLRELPHRHAARILRLNLDASETLWLRALGLAEGAAVEVLRAGLLGGPLQVRVGGHVAFAIDRAVAGAIDVEPAP